MEDKYAFSRRNALKSIIGGSAITVVPTMTAAENSSRESKKRSFKENILKSNDIKERKGISESHTYLEKQGYGVSSVEESYTIEKTDGELSTESFDKDSLDITFSLVHGNCDNYFADLSWEYDLGSFQFGDKPNDVAGISFESGWWQEMGDSPQDACTSSDSVDFEFYGGDGPCFQVTDLYATGEDPWYCGFFATPTGNYGEDERAFYPIYRHHWSEESTTIDSASISYPPSISVTFKNTTTVEDWETEQRNDGDWLHKYQEEADWSGGGSC